MMNGRGKSDSSIVPGKPPNRAEEPAAEAVEGKGLAEGNSVGQNASRTLGRIDACSALERVRQSASVFATRSMDTLLPSLPEAGARCGNSARRDLCGGCRVTGIPTVTRYARRSLR